ncbi:MAG: DMT family transporter [Pseudomonadota bacterium]
MDPSRPLSIGIFCALGASLCFSLNDVSIKFLSGDYPLHQIVFARAAVALTITLIFIMPFEGGFAALRTRRPFLHAFRGLCVVVANSTFFAGIAVMPLADVTAIFFVAPLFITALSVVILKEVVGLRRWTAVAIGLAGVIIVVRPGGASFTSVAILPALAALAYAGLQVMTRKMGLSERASTMAIYIQLTFLFVSGGLGLALGDGRYLVSAGDSGALQFFLRPWVWPDTEDLWRMAFLGVLSACGGYLISQAYRGSDAALIAPFEYSSLILSVCFGYLIWAEVPLMTTWLGIALIAGSGIFIAWRESQVGAKPVAKRVAGRR